VPWSKVGPGWALAMYSASTSDGPQSKAGPSTLYLVDPAGGRYSLLTWPARAAQSGWQLQAWSADGRDALFVSGGFGVKLHVHQLALRTGASSSFTLPANETAIGFSRAGRAVLTERGTPDGLTSTQQVRAYGLTGKLLHILATVQFLGAVAEQPAGRELAAGSVHGLELISTAGGGVLRSLPVPGAKDGCNAIRWWSKATILASCATRNGEPRLWLVPAGGAAPAALTPARGGSSRDLGDFDAWQLSSGLYLDAYGPCGVLQVGKAEPHGHVKMISIPGATSSLIVTATQSRLLVERSGGCVPGVSLAWFNPVTRATTVAIPAHDVVGVVAAVPYFVAGKF
jgi:hypothetical protein